MNRNLMGSKTSRVLSMLLVSAMLLSLSTMAQALTLTLSAEHNPCYLTNRWNYARNGITAHLSDLPPVPSQPPGASCANSATSSFGWSVLGHAPAPLDMNPNPPSSLTDSSAEVSNGYPNSAPFPGGGAFSVTVQCTATYTPPCGIAATDTKTLTVNFFVRVPARMELKSTPGTPNPQVYPFNGEFNGAYGHLFSYQLQIQDNQAFNTFVPSTDRVAQPYADGLPREEFQNVDNADYQPNGTLGGETWGLNYDTGTGTPGSDVTDNIEILRDGNNYYADDPVGSFDQIWHCMELIPPTTPPNDEYVPPGVFGPNGSANPKRRPVGSDFLSNVNDTTLNSHHIVVLKGSDTRTIN